MAWARPMVFWAVSGLILLFITFARPSVADMMEGIAVAVLWIVIGGLMSAVRYPSRSLSNSGKRNEYPSLTQVQPDSAHRTARVSNRPLRQCARAGDPRVRCGASTPQSCGRGSSEGKRFGQSAADRCRRDCALPRSGAPVRTRRTRW